MLYEKITINTDGGSRGNPGPAAIGVVACLADGQPLFRFGEYLGVTTNNVAEYQAVVGALNYLIQNNITATKINFILDSELVVMQLNGLYKIKEPSLKLLHQKIQEHIANLQQLNQPSEITFAHVRREQNKFADKIVNETLDTQV